MPSAQNLSSVFGVCRVVPRACAVAFPLLLRAQHGLVMRGAHDDAVFVCQLGIQRIIFVEGVVPHRGPEVVGLQPQQQLEYLGVELVVVVPDTSRAPSPRAKELRRSGKSRDTSRPADLARTRRASRTAHLCVAREHRPTSTTARRRSAPTDRRCRKSFRACRCRR